nr:unnamed protein product [Callosobruchus analis]
MPEFTFLPRQTILVCGLNITRIPGGNSRNTTAT